MNQQNHLNQKQLGLVKAICASLIMGLPAITLAPSVAIASETNPCPKIYYEEPFNNTRPVPQGCPANEAPQQLNPESETVPLTGEPLPTGVSQPPLPETQTAPVTRIIPKGQRVSVTLKNNTNALITYEAIGHTEERTLVGREEVVLQNLPLPVTITTVRQDAGLLDVITKSTQPGMLEVLLEADPTFDDIKGTISIQEDGRVYIN
ncbi:MAG: hypothetical protein F6K36_07150 [Symploca sp. SIO3C6]|uniref:Uncharacterized protein n=1 Tax=Symploca sp. SIO1C4 TaxID=2607765 RepID=A0A6B3N629_9CYAN|nr:hypothetical protein [Symploca sp. SIO3C6]NER27013.1 hypothetical protein [Symploca sp. SIO1C4]